ncbi:hypothetical protein YC2023_066617 [Brassica napus]
MNLINSKLAPASVCGCGRLREARIVKLDPYEVVSGYLKIMYVFVEKTILDDFEEVFQSSGLPGSHLDFMESYGLPESRLDFLKVIWKSSGLPESHLDFLESIAKITSALTRRLPGKSSTARRLPMLLQAHRISNESDPPIIHSPTPQVTTWEAHFT